MALPGDLGWRLRADLGAARPAAGRRRHQRARPQSRPDHAGAGHLRRASTRGSGSASSPNRCGLGRTDARDRRGHEARSAGPAGGRRGQRPEILCAYDASRLSPARIDGACHAHPEILERDGRLSRAAATGAGTGPPPEAELPPPLSLGGVHRLRLPAPPACGRWSAATRSARGCPPTRCADLVLAVQRSRRQHPGPHGRGRHGAHLDVRTRGQSARCTTADGSPTRWPGGSGRRRTAPGQGLWVVNHVCDLVEMRSGPAKHHDPAAHPPAGQVAAG